MSNNPKNKANTSILHRDGPPDYTQLHTDTKPVITNAEEIGAILEYSDKGDRFRWTGTKWLQTHVSGAPLARDYFTDVASGLVEGESLFTHIVRNPAVGTTFEDLWGAGGEMVYPTGAETWEIVSDSTDDDAGGIGGTLCFVDTLDENLQGTGQAVALNGTTPVTLTGTHFRPHRIFVIAAGSHQANVGTITLRVSGGGATRGIVLPDLSISFDTHYTVPANMTAEIISLFMIFPKDGSGTFVNRFRRTLDTDATWVAFPILQLYQNFASLDFKARPRFSAGSDMRMQVKSDTGTMDVTCIMEFVLRTNGDV